MCAAWRAEVVVDTCTKIACGCSPFQWMETLRPVLGEVTSILNIAWSVNIKHRKCRVTKFPLGVNKTQWNSLLNSSYPRSWIWNLSEHFLSLGCKVHNNRSDAQSKVVTATSGGLISPQSFLYLPAEQHFFQLTGQHCIEGKLGTHGTILQAVQRR